MQAQHEAETIDLPHVVSVTDGETRIETLYGPFPTAADAADWGQKFTSELNSGLAAHDDPWTSTLRPVHTAEPR